MTVNEGEVTRIRPTTVEICMNGSIKLKKKADVGPNFTLACYGEIIFKILNNSFCLFYRLQVERKSYLWWGDHRGPDQNLWKPI